jgi:DNA-binding HxlR family transcriptional regulator
MSTTEELNQILHLFFDEQRPHEYGKLKTYWNIERRLDQLEKDGLIIRTGDIGKDDTRYVLSRKGERLRIKATSKGYGQGYSIYHRSRWFQNWAEKNPIGDRMTTAAISFLFSIAASLILLQAQKTGQQKMDDIQNKKIQNLEDSLKSLRKL